MPSSIACPHCEEVVESVPAFDRHLAERHFLRSPAGPPPVRPLSPGAWSVVDADGVEHHVALGGWRMWLGAPNTFRCDDREMKWKLRWRSRDQTADFEVGTRRASMSKRFVYPRAGIRVRRALGGSIRNLPGTILAYALGGSGVGSGAAAAAAASGMLAWVIYELAVDDHPSGAWVATVIDGAAAGWTFVRPGGVLPNGSDDTWPEKPDR
jgi:hypothetical protein